MDGLIVKKRWLNLILSGKKTIEIRGSNTKKIGQPIYLLESGTNLVKGTCIIDSTYPIDCWESSGCESDKSLKFFKLDFPMVKWSDSEPWLIEDLKKLEVVEEYA